MKTDSKIILAVSGYSAPHAALVELDTETNILICSADSGGGGGEGTEEIINGEEFNLG